MFSKLLLTASLVLCIVARHEETCFLSVDQEPSCDSLGDCAGLRCYSEQLEQNTTVIVDKCTDPIVVNVTISNMTAGLFSQSFTETTNTGAILVTISRNATHVYVQVMSRNGAVQLVPRVAVPVNPSVCQCEDLQYLRDHAEAAEVPFPHSCYINNTRCSGVNCSFTLGALAIIMETEIDSCTNPPGFFVIMKSSGLILFSHFFEKSTNTSVLGFPFYVTVEHREYSMIVEGDLVYSANEEPYPVIPRKQVILDKSMCEQPTVDTVPPIATAPPPVSQETCNAIEDIVERTNADFGTCEPNDQCDGIRCNIVFEYTVDVQFLPCLRPPALHLIIYDPMGSRIYDDIISNTTEVPILPSLGIGILLQIHQGDEFIGVETDIDTDFGLVEFLPYSEIPYDRCLCPLVACDPVGEAQTNIAVIVVPVILVVLVAVSVVVIVLLVVVLVVRRKRNVQFSHETFQNLQDKEEQSSE